MQRKIAFIVPYPIGCAPSQRFRFEQFTSHLNENGISTDFYPFLSHADFNLIYKPGNFLRKLMATLRGFTKRFFLQFKLGKYDIVFIHRESSPVGPPMFEWFVAKLLKKKIIYDFDDAIWMNNTSDSNKLISGVKQHSKVDKICRWSSMVFCGNHFLQEYALQYNKNSFYIPTTIDTENVHNKIKNHVADVITIGWTGTHTTAKYLKEIEQILGELQSQFNFKVVLICNSDPEIQQFDYQYVPWSKDTEIADLLQFDIGLMPLTDNPWTKGKCGFKALQYMALGIPAVISPVGVNTQIVQNGRNGFIANDAADWKSKLEQLINQVELRKELGKAGRKTVIDNYSVLSHKEVYFKRINKLLEL